MSIKKLFDSTDTTRNYLADANEKEAFTDVESARNASAVVLKQDTFLPSINYSKPQNFAKYGSAYLYYKGAMERITDYYPYDGSEAEKNEFYNNLLDVEKYVLNNLYPKATGYINISADAWGSRVGSLVNGYGLPSSQEYITF